MSELVLTLNPKILQYLWEPLNLFPNLCLYCSCSYDYFCEKGTKFHLFEPWNLFAKLSWAHVYTVYVPMIILVKRGQKLRSGAGGGVFFNPKILIKASPSMRISQSPCPVFPNLCFCNFMFLWLFLWKGAKIVWGQGGCFF